MRTIVANTFITLDGVMQAPGGPEEHPSGAPPAASRSSITRSRDKQL